MKKEERIRRVIARGEFSNHSHIITGDAEIRNENGEVIIEVGREGAFLKHLLEKEWLKGKEVWTKEHKDIPLQEGTYKFVQQQEFDPYTSLIQSVRD